jgi:hypothetical protein
VKLENTISSQATIINAKRSASMTALIDSVSSPMPDSEVSKMINKCWGEPFLDWCDDACLDNPKAFEEQFISEGLILPGASYGDTPVGFILLKTALNDQLCRDFLTDPFFFMGNAQDHNLLGGLNQRFEGKSVFAA